MNRGYIKQYRKIMDSFVWTNPYLYKLWSLCLMKASHEKRKFLFNGKEVWLNSGEFVTGRDAITFEMNKGVKREHQVNSGSVWRWLKKFETEGMLNIKSTTKYSVISITNWGLYQSDEQQVNINRTSSEQLAHTNKNEKNDKNEKSHVVRQDEIKEITNLYSQIFGMINSLTAESLNYWCEDLSPSIVKEALKKSAEQNAKNFKYTESILKSWEKRGVKTVEDIKALDTEFEKNKSTHKNKRSVPDNELPETGLDW